MKRLAFFLVFALGFLSFSFSASADMYPSGYGDLNCKKSDRNPLKCLVCSIYFEARGENLSGQVDVGRVMITRVLDERYPDTMCGVVWQDSQFSWTKDGKSDFVPGGEVLAEVVHAAKIAVNSGPNRWVSYYADYIRPYWYRECKKRIRRGSHIFCDKGFQGQGSGLLVRDILLHLEGKDIPIPTPRPRGPHDEIPIPTPRPATPQEIQAQRFQDFQGHLPDLYNFEEGIPEALREGEVFYEEAAGE